MANSRAKNLDPSQSPSTGRRDGHRNRFDLESPMPFVCHFTGKKSSFGKQRTWRGQKIVKGGFGLKPTGITRRKFRPNLQKVDAVVDGVVMTIRASTKAIKQGLVVKPLKRRDGYTRLKKAGQA